MYFHSPNYFPTGKLSQTKVMFLFGACFTRPILLEKNYLKGYRAKAGLGTRVPDNPEWSHLVRDYMSLLMWTKSFEIW